MLHFLKDRVAKEAGAVDALGYEGPIEVEIFNEALWAMPEDKVLTLTKERYLRHV